MTSEGRDQLFSGFSLRSSGGGGRNRTGVDGFAGRCMTTLPPRRVDTSRKLDRCCPVTAVRAATDYKRKGEQVLSLGNMERERSLELPTSTLARLRSTN